MAQGLLPDPRGAYAGLLPRLGPAQSVGGGLLGAVQRYQAREAREPSTFPDPLTLPPYEGPHPALSQDYSGMHPLDKAAMATMAAPVMGDIAGLLADARTYATDPESRTWGNAALSAAGLLPFVPGMTALKGGSGWEVVENFRPALDPDEYLYHATSEANVPSILEQGLLPGGGSPIAGRGGGYDVHSGNRVFVGEAPTAFGWRSKIEDHLFDLFDDPPEAVLLRIPKADIDLQSLMPDELGNRDVRGGSFFSDQPIRRRP